MSILRYMKRKDDDERSHLNLQNQEQARKLLPMLLYWHQCERLERGSKEAPTIHTMTGCEPKLAALPLRTAIKQQKESFQQSWVGLCLKVLYVGLKEVF